MAIYRISLNNISLPKDYELKAVGYQISKTGNFDNEDDLVVNDDRDEEHLDGKEFELDFNEHSLYYGRVKLYMEDGDGNEKTYGWTKPIVLTKDGDGYSHSNVIIGTPKLSIEGDINKVDLGGFRVNGSEFIVFTGDGEHRATDWVIKDTTGTVVWQRLRDPANLTSIRVPNGILKPNKVYVIEARYISTNNMISNTGRLFIRTANTEYALKDLVFSDIEILKAENEGLKEILNDTINALISALALNDNCISLSEALEYTLNTLINTYIYNSGCNK